MTRWSALLRLIGRVRVLLLRPGLPGCEDSARARAGFTLVEVLVVLSIIATMMGLIGPRVLGYLNDSKFKAARIQAETLSTAVELFFIDNGRYPLESEGLQALVSPPGDLRSWNGPYIKGRTVPLDPWGTPYRYAASDRGRGYVITFVRSDARQGGEGASPGAAADRRAAGLARDAR